MQKFIAHCEDENNKNSFICRINSRPSNRLILIGPEGDFTTDEISSAIQMVLCL